MPVMTKKADKPRIDNPDLVSSSDSSDDEHKSNFDADSMPRPISQRGAISSEIPSESAKNFKPPFHKKSGEQQSRISEIIKKSFLFSNLDRKDFETVLGAFEEKAIEEGQELIHQGDEGDCLYLVESGTFDVYKKLSKDTEPQHVNIMSDGSTIGELALLYSAPRAATVIARTGAVVWKLDRDTFSNVVRASAMRKREKFTERLKKVELLKVLSDVQRTQLADALLAKEYAAGDIIIKEGDPGDDFYILDAGAAEAVKNNEAVLLYNPGEYFGELALIRDAPRAATVRATDDCTCLVLARTSFNRLLGPLEDSLKKHAELYSDVPLKDRKAEPSAV
eukprot:Gregarina_sp_Poly_1__4783@NODE_2550_length_1995_cov_7_846992_g1619_i0_p1_GENE_NODE_2550_length_1995_cov_7_846992_g1619_i0NODE_2550_length_1995_cov_7_846992_g1619_i0_p1_ORF_typecomplete_len336_score53_04cNMP_binding/PF00027_29/4_9e23cNMP_binding/PF00027_29/1_2e23Popeye/PF04831_13/0_25Popeye/PF04831_13/0_018_NODE_2550_length_1995_cov_7_846992_g1619_i05321539